jgi:esterase/lipase
VKPNTKGAKHEGRDLILHDLTKKVDHHFGSVSQHAFNKPGTLLAYTRDAADQTGNGLYILNLRSGLRIPLDQDSATYSNLIWDEDGTALALLKGNPEEGFVHRRNLLLVVTFSSADNPETYTLDPSENVDFPGEMTISEKSDLFFSSPATRVFFGIKDQEPDAKKKRKSAKKSDQREEAPKDEDPPVKDPAPSSNLDIWHWKDERIQSVQRSRAQRQRNRTDRAVFHLEDRRFLRLTDETMKSITLTRDGNWGIGTDDREFVHDWKTPRVDHYRVNIQTGERELILAAHHQTLRLASRRGRARASALSPDGKYFLYWKDSQFWLYDLASATTVNLTKDAAVEFTDQQYDYPGDQPSYGISGWTRDGNAVVLNHRYDLWRQPLDGSSATNLTAGLGSKEEIRFRVLFLDEEERSIDLSRPVWLEAYGEWTKKAGFFQLNPQKAPAAIGEEPTPLIFKDRSFGRLSKAKKAERYMVTIESFALCPDYYVADKNLENLRRITDANPQQVEYRWGHRVLFDYTSNDGVRLQAALAVPDRRKPDERLPMLVSFYEKTSHYLHAYERPRYARSSGSHLMETVSKGYLLLSPDIHFNTGATGDDMLECVEAAVDRAVELGYADPDRVGLCGFSFSGYGATYIATRSNKFAAVSAGAGVMELGSDFHHLWGYSVGDKRGAGENAHQYNIYGQGRMGTDPHEDFELYRDQSPLTHVPQMTTPVLFMQGEADSTVAWIEAVSIYNAMRFHGKNIILLSYPDEGHGLSKRVNRIDFTRRVMEFFDHHLKDTPAPDWMTRGVPFLEKPKQ